MKKFLFFVTACIALVACNQNEPTAPGRQVTLTATVNLGNGSYAPVRTVAPNTPIDTTAGATLNFHWEAGDKVIIKNASGKSTFTIVDGSISGNQANFTGTALSDMSSYNVYYNYDPDATNPDTVEYVAGSFRPFINGTGNDDGFTLNTFLPVLHIRLILNENDPSDAIYYIRYYLGYLTAESGHEDPSEFLPLATVMLANGISPADTTDVYLPVSATDATGFTLEFLNINEELIEPSLDGCHVPDYKYLSTELNLTDKTNNIVFISQAVEMNCLAAGTKITMADGTTKLVEDIQLGDLVRTFDHETGAISSEKICLAWKGETKERSLDLTFASGKQLSIVGTHDLLLENTRKYVRVNSGNVADYVGKRFYNVETGNWDALVSYKIGTPVDFYCIYSANHINCVAEGLLTCPDDVDFCLNIYELDANLKADAAQLATDIETYGLYDINVIFPEVADDPKYAYSNPLYRYAYIAIGKGLITKEELLELVAANVD